DLSLRSCSLKVGLLIMITKRYFLSFSLLIFFLGCTKEHEGLTYQFATKEEAKIQLFPYEHNWLINPEKVCFIQDLVLIYADEEHLDHYFYLYNREGNFLASFGNKEGEHLLYNPQCDCQFIQQEDQLEFVSYDHGSHYLTFFDIKAILEGKTEIVTRTIRGPNLYMPKGIYFNPAHHSILGLGGGANGVVFNYDIAKKELHWSTEKPVITKNYSKAVTDLIFTASSSIDAENNVLSIAYILFNRLDQYNLQGQFLHSIYYEDIEQINPIIVNDFPDPRNKLQYTHVQSKYGYHYIVYQGHASSEADGNNPPQLHIINYDGQPIKALQLPYHIQDFTLMNQDELMLVLKTEKDTHPQLYTLKIDF
ncbi:MAG: hypothetical protein AAF985_00955, partial [Bacteroidota bacterium]